MEEQQANIDILEKELEEYKELLWQLSDEYKLNVTAAENKVKEELQRREILEIQLKDQENLQEPNFIYQLGLPACIINDNGEITAHNNKFKFLIDLLFSDFEEIVNIQPILAKDLYKKLDEKVKVYLDGDQSLFQSLYIVKNSFQGLIHLILRIYRFESEDKHLALFVEIHKNELETIKGSSVKQKEEKQIIQEQTKTEEPKEEKPVIVEKIKVEEKKDNSLMFAIQSLAQRYEIAGQLLSFINKKINDKTENVNLMREIYTKIEKSFPLEKERKSIFSKLNITGKEFSLHLKQKYPELTTNEQKQCLLIKFGLSYKEIAALMDISVNGVKIARNRLRKKLNLQNGIKTAEFLMKI